MPRALRNERRRLYEVDIARARRAVRAEGEAPRAVADETAGVGARTAARQVLGLVGKAVAVGVAVGVGGAVRIQAVERLPAVVHAIAVVVGEVGADRRAEVGPAHARAILERAVAVGVDFDLGQ